VKRNKGASAASLGGFVVACVILFFSFRYNEGEKRRKGVRFGFFRMKARWHVTGEAWRCVQAETMLTNAEGRRLAVYNPHIGQGSWTKENARQKPNVTPFLRTS
jgi:hypothetical protein